MSSHLNVQAEPAAVQRVEAFVAAFAEQHRIDPGDRNRVTVLLEELVTNLYKHGLVVGSGGCTAEIVLSLDQDRLLLPMNCLGCCTADRHLQQPHAAKYSWQQAN